MLKDYQARQVEELLKQHYNLRGELKELGGYTDKNFLLKMHPVPAHQQNRLIVKISSSLEKRELIELQNEALKKLQTCSLKCKSSCLIPTTLHGDMIVLSEEGASNYLRVFTYIEGEQMQSIEDPPQHLFDEAGRIAAELSIFLGQLGQQKIAKQGLLDRISQQHHFNLCSFNQLYEKYSCFLDTKIFPLVQKIKVQFDGIYTILKETPKQILHNDLCQSNILVHRDKRNQLHVSGIIDFSSLIYSHKIIELVIICARMNLYTQQPLRNMLRIIKAYDSVQRLTPEEKAMIFPLIKVRLAFLCLISSFLARQKESEPYFARCKNGHLLYLTTIANHCNNQTFLEKLEEHLSRNQE